MLHATLFCLAVCAADGQTTVVPDAARTFRSLTRLIPAALSMERPRPDPADARMTFLVKSPGNAEVGYRFSRYARVALEGDNLFDSEVSDIDYFYAMHLQGEPGGGVEDLHTLPVISRTARISLQVSF